MMTRGLVVLVLGIAAIAAGLLFVHVLAAYWHFYHLDTPEMGWALVLVALPAAVIVAFGSGWVASLRFQRYGATGALWRSGVVIAIVLGSLVLFELLRTTAERSREGERAGDLLPYFTYHLR
jgi:hypothetical protein